MNDDGRSLNRIYRSKSPCACKKISHKITHSLKTHPQKIRQTSPRPKSLKNVILKRRQIISLSGAATSLGLAVPLEGLIDKGLRWKSPFLNNL